MPDSPLERVHPAHRASDDGRPTFDAECIAQRNLRGHLIANCDKGEACAELGSIWCMRCRTGAALAPAQNIGGDDKPTVGVYGLAWTNDVIPPPRGGMSISRTARNMAVAGERVRDENRVRGIVIEGADCLVGDAHRSNLSAELE